jgi:hypothetical protein
MRGGPANIGLYIVQTDGRQVGHFYREERERYSPIFDVFGAIHGLCLVHLIHKTVLIQIHSVTSSPLMG